jgi:hypothetical protein
MKPLRRAPLTKEDDDALQHRLENHWGYRSADFWHDVGSCEDSDRRDADLMHVLTSLQMREACDRQTWVRGGPDGDFISIRPAALVYVDAHL